MCMCAEGCYLVAYNYYIDSDRIANAPPYHFINYYACS